MEEFDEFESVPYYFTGKCRTKNDGAIRYFEGGRTHRLDGPAIEYPGESFYWFKHGSLHRLDGPAAFYTNRDKEWWIDGHLHRLDGPAIEKHTGESRFFVRGKRYSKEEFNALPEVIMHKAGLGVFS